MAKGFRLGGLLRLRRLQEEQAAAELARANAERRKADKRRQDTEDMLAGTMLPHRSDELSWRAAIAGRAALTGLVGEAAIAVDLAGRRAGSAADAWSGARTRATTLTKLEERHTQSVRAEEARTEQLVLDEAASRGARAAALAAEALTAEALTAEAPSAEAAAQIPGQIPAQAADAHRTVTSRTTEEER